PLCGHSQCRQLLLGLEGLPNRLVALLSDLSQSFQLASRFCGATHGLVARGFGLAPCGLLVQSLGLEPCGQLALGLDLFPRCRLQLPRLGDVSFREFELLNCFSQSYGIAACLGSAPGCLLDVSLGLMLAVLLVRGLGVPDCGGLAPDCSALALRVDAA